MSLAKLLQIFAGSFANNFSLGINAFTAQESCGDFGISSMPSKGT